MDVEYSLNGGSSWNPTPLASFTGFQDWFESSLDASVLDNQPNVALRLHLTSDSNTNFDGFYVDDISLSYEPFECNYTPVPEAPTLVSPADEAWVNSPVTFVWQADDNGVPPEGYVFYLDGTPVVTFTEPITTTTLDVSSWSHTWYVVATSASGTSLPSPTWAFQCVG